MVCLVAAWEHMPGSGSDQAPQVSEIVHLRMLAHNL
jgi:hypothetical protein